MLSDKIYYADQIQPLLDNEFILVETAPWYRLYKHKANGTLWRLDERDKYQEQYFVRIDDYANWKDFNATELQIELLKKERGITGKECSWSLCANKALKGLVFCERHAYLEMGVRR
ncbi:MAG: hypothetical protein ACJ75B_08370 [Flavisolibacter sp.]